MPNKMLYGKEITKVVFDEAYLQDLDQGRDFVTEELLESARDLLSSALPEDANDTVIQGFWQAVYDHL